MLFRPIFPHLRHPLARVLATALGALVFLVLLVFGAFALIALLVGGAVLLLIHAFRAPRPASAARPSRSGVIEGEFSVVHDPHGARDRLP